MSRVYRKGRRRPGSTLVEMLIALMILSLMLFSIMAVMMISTRNTVAAKEAMGASLAALSELERMEAVRVTAASSDQRVTSGEYAVTFAVVPTDALDSADITVSSDRRGGGVMSAFGDRVFKRQVSPSAWQNAGEVPD